jgi:hypothetical protein
MLTQPPAEALDAAPAPALGRRRALQRGAGWTLLGLQGLRLAQGAALQEVAATLPAELQEALPAAQALGAARMRFLGLDIYQARLWAGPGFDARNYAQSPFALELNYARSLSGRLIAERSLKEMRRQASLPAQQEAGWLAAMVAAFPDVQAGDRITGLNLPAQGARFWFNGQARPSVRDAEFSRLFFGIWLSEASSEPQLRAELLGRSS